MKIEIELTRITKTNIETKEGEKDVYNATFEDKDNGIKVSISQEEAFDLVIGQKYSLNLTSEQKTL